MRKAPRRLAETNYCVDFSSETVPSGGIYDISLRYNYLQGTGYLQLRFRHTKNANEDSVLEIKLREALEAYKKQNVRYTGTGYTSSLISVHADLDKHTRTEEDLTGLLKDIVSRFGYDKKNLQSCSVRHRFEFRTKSCEEHTEWIDEGFLLGEELRTVLPA